MRLLTPVYEFVHFAEGGFFGLSLPASETAVVPSQRFGLFWGESVVVP